jgi:hypothetical protein
MTKEKIATLNQKHQQKGRYTTVDDCISTINEDRIKHNLKGIAYVYLTVEDGEPIANYLNWAPATSSYELARCHFYRVNLAKNLD